MIITVILVVTAALIALFTYHLRRLKLYKAAAKFPGPKTWPLIGNADLFFGDGESEYTCVVELIWQKFIWQFYIFTLLRDS